MDEYPSAINNEPTNQKPNRLKALALLKIGLFELFFVAIVLFLLFGTLNYFNILSVSDAFPNQFGWLPRQTQQKKLSTNQTIAKPTLTMSLEEKTKETFMIYIPTILTSSLLPHLSSDINIAQNQETNENFTISWDTKEGTISAFLTSNQNVENISEIYISWLQPQSLKPSIVLASTISANFFSAQPKGTWNCKSLKSSTVYCENFWEEANGVRRGIGIQGIFTRKYGAGPPTVAEVFFCEHTKDNPLSYFWKSCAKDFSEKGI